MASELNWSSASDWDNAQSESGVVHETYTDTNAGSVQLGYDSSWLSDLVAVYPLDEESGSTIYGYGPGATNGTLNGGALGRSGGVVGTSRLEFGGSGGHVDLGSPSSLQLKQPLTIAGWVEFSSLSGQKCITTWANGNYNDYPFHLTTSDSNNLRFNQSVSEAVDSSYSFSTGERVFWAVTKDTNYDVRFYFNGSPDSTNPSSYTQQTSDGDTYATIGRASDQYMDGYENYVMYFDGALSDTQISNLHDTVSSGSLTAARKVA